MTIGGPVEGLWIAINLTTILFSAVGLLDAVRSWQAWRKLNGHGPGIIASGDARREAFRLIEGVLLLVVSYGPLTHPGDVPISVPVVLVMIVAACVTANTIGDAFDRHRLWNWQKRRDRRLEDEEREQYERDELAVRAEMREAIIDHKAGRPVDKP